MLSLNKFSQNAIGFLREKGVDTDAILVALGTDRSCDGMPREAFAFLFEDRLEILEGITAIIPQTLRQKVTALSPRISVRRAMRYSLSRISPG